MRKLIGHAALALALGCGAAHAQQDTVKIGVIGPKTGFMAAGAAVTHWPNFKLWVQEVNDRGGLKLKAGQRKEEAGAPKQRNNGDEVRGPTEDEPGAEGWNKGSRDPGRSKNDVRGGAEQP